MWEQRTGHAHDIQPRFGLHVVVPAQDGAIERSVLRHDHGVAPVGIPQELVDLGAGQPLSLIPKGVAQADGLELRVPHVSFGGDARQGKFAVIKRL